MDVEGWNNRGGGGRRGNQGGMGDAGGKGKGKGKGGGKKKGGSKGGPQRQKVIPPFLQKAHDMQNAAEASVEDKKKPARGFKDFEDGDSDDEEFDLENAAIAGSNMSPEELEMFLRKRKQNKQQAAFEKKMAKEKAEADAIRAGGLSMTTFKPKFQSKGDRKNETKKKGVSGAMQVPEKQDEKDDSKRAREESPVKKGGGVFLILEECEPRMKVYGLTLPGNKIAGRFDGQVFRKNVVAKTIEIQWNPVEKGGPDPKSLMDKWLIKQGRTEYNEAEFEAARPRRKPDDGTSGGGNDAKNGGAQNGNSKSGAPPAKKVKTNVLSFGGDSDDSDSD